MIWFTSDWHFNHNKDFIYGARGFSSVRRMNEAIVARHNAVVSPDDTVYCLGDLAMGEIEDAIPWLSQLNGNIKVIRGNHDTDRKVECYESLGFEVIGWADMIKIGKCNVYLSHYQSSTANYDDGKHFNQNVLNFYGHTHQKYAYDFDRPFSWHVGVDSNDCYPVSADEIINTVRDAYIKSRGI